MSAIQIRNANFDDMPQIVLIKNIAWVYAYKGIMSEAFLLNRTSAVALQRTVLKWQQVVQTGTSIFLVAENSDGIVIGFAWGGDVSHPFLETDKELYALYVHPAAHGVGVGRVLMRAFAQQIWEKGGG